MVEDGEFSLNYDVLLILVYVELVFPIPFVVLGIFFLIGISRLVLFEDLAMLKFVLIFGLINGFSTF